MTPLCNMRTYDSAYSNKQMHPLTYHVRFVRHIGHQPYATLSYSEQLVNVDKYTTSSA